MKKTLIILFLIIFFQSNAHSFVRGSGGWLKWSSHQDLVNFYAEKELDGICDYWVKSKDWSTFKKEKNRKAMKQVLSQQGHDRFICMKLASP